MQVTTPESLNDLLLNLISRRSLSSRISHEPYTSIMEVGFSEMLVYFYQTTRLHIFWYINPDNHLSYAPEISFNIGEILGKIEQFLWWILRTILRAY
jgi:hypothetical protein